MAKVSMKKILAWLALFAVFAFCTVLIYPRDTYADSDINGKAMASAVIDCYKTNQFKTPVTRNNLYRSDISTFMTGSKSVYVPTSYNGDPTVTCGSYVRDLLSRGGHSIPDSKTPAQDVTAFMVGLGYTADSNGGASGKCVSFNFTGDYMNGKFTTQKICAKSIDGNGNVNTNDMEIVAGNNDYVTFSYKKGKVEACTALVYAAVGKERCESYPVTTWDKLVSDVSGYMLDRARYTGDCSGYVCTYELDDIGSGVAKVNSYGSTTATYNLAVDERSLTNGTRYLTGSTYGEYPTFLAGEQFVLYQNYLVDYYDAVVYCDWNDEEVRANGSGYSEVRLYKDGSFKKCYAKAADEKRNDVVGGIYENKHFGMPCNFACITSWLKNSTVLTLPSSVSEPTEGPSKEKVTDSDDEGGSGGSSRDSDGFCDEAVDKDGGIGSMQWILCPTLDNTTYTANWMDEITQYYLEVDPEMYRPGGSLEGTWSAIRNITNVVMVLFFLVIIGSQITGYGIDNYGIKKMLPRLIVMAIVINLSFYICALAVDLSNIAGEGLRDMFGAIGGGDGSTNSFVDVVMGLFGVGATAAGSAAGAASLAVTLGAGGWVVAVVIVVVLVVVVIAALAVLWLMLGAREIIIVFCILLSPLAFAAFILPNTQNLFKKWWELFKAAIIIFPICGAVAGISTALKNLNLVGMGTAGQLVELVLPYLVFFLIPLLLEQAIAALGKIGGALTAAGNTIRRGGKAIGSGAMQVGKNTEWYKNLQREGRRSQVFRRNDKLNKRFEDARRKAEAENASDRDKKAFEKMQTGRRGRMYAQAELTAQGLEKEDVNAAKVLMNKQYTDVPLERADGEGGESLIKMLTKAADAGDYEKVKALQNLISDRHGSNGAVALGKWLAGRKIFEGGDSDKFAGNTEEERKANENLFNAIRNNAMDNTSLLNNLGKKDPHAFQMLTNGGYYVGDDGKTHRGNVDAHAAHDNVMTKDTDRAAAGSVALLRALQKKSLTSEDATRMLNSNDPAMLSGILSEKSKVDMLKAASMGFSNWSGDYKKDPAFSNAINRFDAANPSWGNQAKKAREAYEAILRTAGAMENAARTMASNVPSGGNFGSSPTPGSNPGPRPNPGPGPNNPGSNQGNKA